MEINRNTIEIQINKKSADEADLLSSFGKKNLLPLISLNQSRQGSQHDDQAEYCQNKIAQECIRHRDYLPFNKLRLKVQKAKVATEPIRASQGLNFSRTAGKTTDAKATRPMSAAISDSLEICESENLGNLIASMLTSTQVLST